MPHKITKDIEKDIRLFCKALPFTPMEVKVFKRIKGSDLLALDPKAKVENKAGLKVDPDPDTIYVGQFKDAHPVNHYRRVKKLYKLHGPASLDMYLRGLKADKRKLK